VDGRGSIAVGTRFFSTTSRPAVGSTLPPTQCDPWAVSRGVRRPECVAGSFGLHSNDKWLVVLRGAIDVYCENSTKGINALQGKYTDFKAGGTYGYHWALNE
jgi:hypothetical protein